MESEKKQDSPGEQEEISCKRLYSKPSLQSFGLVSEVTAGGRGSDPEVGDCGNQGIKKKDDPDCE